MVTFTQYKEQERLFAKAKVQHSQGLVSDMQLDAMGESLTKTWLALQARV